MAKTNFAFFVVLLLVNLNTAKANDTKIKVCLERILGKLLHKSEKETKALKARKSEAKAIAIRMRKEAEEGMKALKSKRDAAKAEGMDLVAAFFNKSMVKMNNRYVEKLYALFKKHGVKASIIRSSDPEAKGVKVLDIIPTSINSRTPKFQKLVKHIQKKFGAENITISLYENVEDGTEGFQVGKRVELGPEQAALIFEDLASDTTKHETRHLMLDSEDSVYNQVFTSKGKKKLREHKQNDEDIYAEFMHAQEIYTYSTDVGENARKMLRNLSGGVQEVDVTKELITEIFGASKILEQLSKQTGPLINENLSVLQRLKRKISGEALSFEELEVTLKDLNVEVYSDGISITTEADIVTVIGINDMDASSVTGVLEAVGKAIKKQESLKQVADHQTDAVEKLISKAVNTYDKPTASNQESLARQAIELSNSVKEHFKGFAGK